MASIVVLKFADVPRKCCRRSPKRLLNTRVRDCKDMQDKLKDITEHHYKFSSSPANPKNLDIDNNLNLLKPSRYPKWKKLISRSVALGLPLGIIYFFYVAFSSDYNLETEKLLMKALPSYEQDMKANPNYVRKLEEAQERSGDGSVNQPSSDI